MLLDVSSLTPPQEKGHTCTGVVLDASSLSICPDDPYAAASHKRVGLLTRLGPLNTFPQEGRQAGPGPQWVTAPSNACSPASHSAPAHDHPTYSQECRPLGKCPVGGRIDCPHCTWIAQLSLPRFNFLFQDLLRTCRMHKTYEDKDGYIPMGKTPSKLNKSALHIFTGLV